MESRRFGRTVELCPGLTDQSVSVWFGSKLLEPSWTIFSSALSALLCDLTAYCWRLRQTYWSVLLLHRAPSFIACVGLIGQTSEKVRSFKRCLLHARGRFSDDTMYSTHDLKTGLDRYPIGRSIQESTFSELNYSLNVLAMPKCCGLNISTVKVTRRTASCLRFGSTKTTKDLIQD